MAYPPEKLKIAEETLDLLETKARTMSVQMWANLVWMPRFEPMTLALQGMLRLHAKDITVKGKENLDKATKKASDEGKTIIFTPKHDADLNTPAIRAGLEIVGYRHLANNTVWIAGENMLIRPQILPFTLSEEVIYIATPDDLYKIEQSLKNPALSPIDLRRAQWIELTFKRMNKKAAEKEREAITLGKHLGVYPEGGRSYDGYMKKAPRQVVVYLPRDGSAVVIPVVVKGTDEINPPNQDWSPEKVLPENRKDVEVIFGESYSSSDPWTWKKRGRERIDLVMAHIFNTDPTVKVRVEEREIYREVMLEYDDSNSGLEYHPGRNRISLI